MATAVPFGHRVKTTVVLKPSLLSDGELKEDMVLFMPIPDSGTN